MAGNEFDISNIIPPKKDSVERFATADSSVPSFIKEAAYTYEETREETIQKDWERLVVGLSDYVLAEQLTERELLGMGKPVAENYSEYFADTLGDVKKNRKKAEQRLFKLIPRHSQLESCEFFERVAEQNEKEKEARERAMELYPFAGVAKIERKDVARKGLKKEAGPAWTAPEAQQGSQTNQEATTCGKCAGAVAAKTGVAAGGKTYCQKCHDAGYSSAQPAAKPMTKEAEEIEINLQDVHVEDEAKISVKPNHPETLKKLLEEKKEESAEPVDVHLMKEATGKWKPGQHLYAKWNKALAYVVYVNADDKTYTIKVDGTMYPSYYTFPEAHEVFDAVSPEETKDGAWAKARGLS